MAEDRSKQPIIIKRVKKSAHASHGGAWKIAYADFVTAMMAFFLLLWLLNSVTQEQLEGISNYFAPVSVSATTSGSGGILGGKTATVEGVAQSTTSRDSVTVDLPPPKAGTGGDDSGGAEAASDADPDAEAAEKKMRQVEQEQFEDAQKKLEEQIAGNPELEKLKDSLAIDNTPEGMRIQLIDKEGLAMFPSGAAEMHAHTRKLLEQVSKVILSMPQNISISGHTDAQKFAGEGDYGNWELSADRANAARRALVGFDVPEKRLDRVVGKAATDPYKPDDPAHASNRRLSIILLRGTGDQTPPQTKDKPKKKDGEALPGLDDIKKRQLDSDEKAATPAEPAAPAPAAAPAANTKAAKPLLPIRKIRPSQGEALPGLEDIKKRQLEEEKKPKPNLKIEVR